MRIFREIALPVARGVRLDLPVIARKNDKSALGAEKRDGVIGDARKQAPDVMLRSELACDLENAREAIFGGKRRRQERARVRRGAQGRAIEA